jgi:indolepyruvate ferredoxin oxidoreductase alpha subunit
MDTCVCMGASITLGHGIEKALAPDDKRRVVTFIGDSTFFHMGLPGLVNTVYNQGNSITIIVDNRTTGMTGHQDHPGTGKTLMGKPAKLLDIAEVVKALGIEKVYVIDPYFIKDNRPLLRKVLSEPGPAVIVSRRPCALLVERKPSKKVVAELCKGCKLCLQLGCPAMSLVEDKVLIDDTMCGGCGMCMELCARKAIV